MNLDRLQQNLSQIRYIHERKCDGDVDLYSLFKAVFNGRALDLNRRKMEYILNVDLKVITEHLDRRLVSVLSESLVYYTTLWPDWIILTDLPRRESADFERFTQYLNFKVNYIIKHAVEYHERKVTYEKGVQTEILKKQLAPYNLIIGGPASVINNLVFAKHGGDIIVKQHPEKQWQEIQVVQFLNWPYVSVTVKMPDISLTRCNAHKVNRYVALQGEQVVIPEIHYIDHITKTNPGADFVPYSYTFFFYYFLQLNIVLQKIPNVSAERLNELAVIFAEFLNDIKEMSVYNSTMSTHSSIGFNIGRCYYMRSKKMVCKANDGPVDKSGITFFEIIVPQVDVSLDYFTAVQDQSDLDSDEITFESLNSILTKLDDPSNCDVQQLAIMINNSSVSYNCILCNECFSGPFAYPTAIDHFKEAHKSEPLVLCFKCGQQFEIEFLSNKRWSHNCMPK